MIRNLANIITAFRAMLAIIVLIFLGGSDYFKLTAILLIPVVMIMDMFDGIAARKTNSQSMNGSVYDILADRMIEFAFFVFFASHHLCSFWAALIIIWRGLLLDTIRAIALRQGKTAFGESSLHVNRWAKRIVSSRFSRGTYNTLKTLAFMLMGLQLYQPLPSTLIESVVWITVAWSLIRAIPVINDGYQLVKT